MYITFDENIQLRHYSQKYNVFKEGAMLERL